MRPNTGMGPVRMKKGKNTEEDKKRKGNVKGSNPGLKL